MIHITRRKEGRRERKKERSETYLRDKGSGLDFYGQQGQSDVAIVDARICSPFVPLNVPGVVSE